MYAYPRKNTLVTRIPGLGSGAGRAAVYLARVCPVARIFIPDKDGISHNEIENTLPGPIEAGRKVLLHCMHGQVGIE